MHSQNAVFAETAQNRVNRAFCNVESGQFAHSLDDFVTMGFLDADEVECHEFDQSLANLDFPRIEIWSIHFKGFPVPSDEGA